MMDFYITGVMAHTIEKNIATFDCFNDFLIIDKIRNSASCAWIQH